MSLLGTGTGILFNLSGFFFGLEVGLSVIL